MNGGIDVVGEPYSLVAGTVSKPSKKSQHHISSSFVTVMTRATKRGSITYAVRGQQWAQKRVVPSENLPANWCMYLLAMDRPGATRR